jgi:RNAse (barnase) inhibitor barstar
MANFLIFSTKDQLSAFKNYHLASIDGAKTTTLKTFFEQIEKALQLPDYFGHNLDSLDELLNDLEWIENEDVALVVTNTEQWLAQEKKQTKLLDLLALLDATAEDWKWLDETDDLPHKNLKILLQSHPKLVNILDEEGIGYEVLIP